VAISSTTNYLDQFQKASDNSDEFKSFAQVQKSDIENNLDYRTELNDPNNLFIASTAAGFGTGFVARKMALGSVEKKTFKAAQGAFNSTAEAGIDRYLTEEIKGNKKFIDSILSGNVDSLDKYGQEAARTLGGSVQSEALNH
jgi:hypothetical protein